MPYEGEFAHYRSLHRIASSERVKKLLGNYRLREAPSATDPASCLQPVQIQPSEWAPSWVLAIDGSHAEVSIRNGYPGAEAAYVTVASVLLDLDRVRELDRSRPVDPQEFRKTERAESIDCALPGCNVIFEGESTARSSLRRTMYDVFASVQMSTEGETLLETYEVLLRHKPADRDQRCPYEDCPRTPNEYNRGVGRYPCSCPLTRPLYCTDALRIHEGMNPAGTNGALFAEIMQVWERVWVVHILRTLEARGWLSSLRRLAVVLDGPLAVFGHPAWLSHAISQELMRLNEVAKRATGGQDLLLIGIEKTGTFVQHLWELDQFEQGGAGKIAPQSALLPTDSYIKRNIIFSESSKPYGVDTYFGRKFFYKTRSGALIVATLPFLEASHRNLEMAESAQFPRLADATALLDQLVCSRYPNSLAPLVAAHAEAAIPLNIGKKVLERLARELVSEPEL